jgi:6-phosphogluconate dehydrogenase
VQIAMIGLGRMGGNMALRLLRGGHDVVVFDPGADKEPFTREGARPIDDLKQLRDEMQGPRAVWVMVPAGKITEDTITNLMEILEPGDVIIDGGNSNFRVSIEDGKRTAEKGLEFIDVGTSGGIWGLTEGYALMVGGSEKAVAHLQPAFDTLAPPGGFVHAGPVGAGHFTKMVHNGIEYGMMQSIAEGFELMHEIEDFDLNLAEIAESWRYGSVVRSWLIDLTANALKDEQGFAQIRGYVEDSGEGKWTIEEALRASVPLPAITASLFARFTSRQDESFAARINAALRNQFGGHAVKLESGESSGPKGKPGS